MIELASLLEDYTPESKEDLIYFITSRLTLPGVVMQLWNNLDTLQKKAVAETLYSPQALFPQTQFRAKYGTDPDWGKALPGKKFSSPSTICLFIYKLQIPAELKSILSGFVGKPGKVNVKHTDNLPLYREDTNKRIISLNTEYAVMHEFPSILHAIGLHRVGVSSSTGKLSRSGINELNKLLYGGDYFSHPGLSEKEYEKIGDIKAYGWFTILKTLNLVYSENSLLKLTDKGKKLESLPPYDSIRRIWHEWLKADGFDELSRIEALKGQHGKGKKFLTDVTGRRRVCMNALLACPPNVWISLDDLFSFMLARGYGFYVTTSPETLYISDPLLGHMGYTEEEGWNIIEKRYVLAFFFEYMATLGLLDIAYTDPAGSRPDYYHVWGGKQLAYVSRYDGLLYFRINNLGKYCLGLSDQYTRTPFKKTTELKVLSNLEIVAVKPLHPGDAYYLGLFTLQKSENVWELDSAKMTSAVEQGCILSLFIDFLRSKCNNEIPDNVAHFLTEIDAKQNSLKVNGRALIIKAESPDLARFIVNNRRLQSCCLIAGEKIIVVPEDSKKVFLKVIHDLGYSLPLKDFML
ncbi:MAG: hypothetical protein JXB88_02720 [Spirochaetales bacterium]|nr:hypothetical protein [Spirochaetales bacterium]